MCVCVCAFVFPLLPWKHAATFLSQDHARDMQWTFYQILFRNFKHYSSDTVQNFRWPMLGLQHLRCPEAHVVQECEVVNMERLKDLEPQVLELLRNPSGLIGEFAESLRPSSERLGAQWGLKGLCFVSILPIPSYTSVWGDTCKWPRFKGWVRRGCGCVPPITLAVIRGHCSVVQFLHQRFFLFWAQVHDIIANSQNTRILLVLTIC